MEKIPVLQAARETFIDNASATEDVLITFEQTINY